jgi:hypothetical protein
MRRRRYLTFKDGIIYFANHSIESLLRNCYSLFERRGAVWIWTDNEEENCLKKTFVTIPNNAFPLSSAGLLTSFGCSLLYSNKAVHEPKRPLPVPLSTVAKWPKPVAPLPNDPCLFSVKQKVSEVESRYVTGGISLSLRFATGQLKFGACPVSSLMYMVCFGSRCGCGRVMDNKWKKTRDPGFIPRCPGKFLKRYFRANGTIYR